MSPPRDARLLPVRILASLLVLMAGSLAIRDAWGLPKVWELVDNLDAWPSDIPRALRWLFNYAVPLQMIALVLTIGFNTPLWVLPRFSQVAVTAIFGCMLLCILSLTIRRNTAACLENIQRRYAAMGLPFPMLH